MRILFTGASSVTGSQVLKRILDSVEDVEAWCVRHQAQLPLFDSRVRVVDLDLSEDFDFDVLPDKLDLVIHFAGVTHAHDLEQYKTVNLYGTTRLAEAVQARGCKRFVYISTRCATRAAGAYGESKLSAEEELKKFSWSSLLTIRPSEIYGGGGREGVDRLIALARRWRLTPVLFGDSNINFAPINVDDFATIVADEIMSQSSGVKTLEVCGPEDLSGPAMGWRIARRFSALPIPLWWPLLEIFIKIAERLGITGAAPDQMQRLTCTKTSYARTAHQIGTTRFLVDRA